LSQTNVPIADPDIAEARCHRVEWKACRRLTGAKDKTELGSSFGGRYDHGIPTDNIKKLQ